MKKDLIGLIIYIFSIMAMSWLAKISFSLFEFISFRETSDVMNFFALNIVPVSLIILPIVITMFAILQKWSRYLDVFFNQLKLPSLILVIAILVIVIFRHGKTFSFYVSTVAVSYCYAYIAILIKNLGLKLQKEY